MFILMILIEISMIQILIKKKVSLLIMVTLNLIMIYEMIKDQSIKSRDVIFNRQVLYKDS